MIVWLARHGATAAVPGVAIGWTDVELALDGHRQAEALAARLASEPLAHVYSSDLRRSLDTATIVAARHALPVEATADLREIHFGAWEGRRLEDLWTERPAEARVWEADVRNVPPSFGETFGELDARVTRFAHRLLDSRGDVLVVAHRGSLAVLHALLRGARIEAALQLPFDPGTLIPLEVA